jgi:hypothetical protein
MPRLAKKTKIDRDEGVIEGVRALLMSRPRLVIRDKAYLPADVIAKYQRHLQSLERVSEAWKAWQEALFEEALVEEELAAFHEDLKRMLFTLYGPQSRKLLRFNVKPREEPKVTAQSKARANEKRQATRKERGILGRRRGKG